MPRHCTYCDSKSHRIGSCPKLPHGDRHREEKPAAPELHSYQRKAAHKAAIVCGAAGTPKRVAKPKPVSTWPRKDAAYGKVDKRAETKVIAAVQDTATASPPTKAQIKAEIKKLKAMKPFIPVKSYFGDNNHDSLDAEAATLEEDLSKDQIMERYLPDEDKDPDADDDHENGRTFDIESSAREARNWMDGERDSEPPSEGWKALATSRGWKP